MCCLATAADKVPVTDNFASASIPTANQLPSGGGLICGMDNDVLIPDTPSSQSTVRFPGVESPDCGARQDCAMELLVGQTCSTFTSDPVVVVSRTAGTVTVAVKP